METWQRRVSTIPIPLCRLILAGDVPAARLYNFFFILLTPVF